MKAVGYIRVSTEMQASDGVSMDAQRAKVDAWVSLHDAELVGVYADAGISGKRTENRDGLCEALDVACRSKAALVVYSLSRLSRSTRDTLAIAERLDECGADLVSLSEQIDTTTAAGKMVFRMLAVLAEFERDQLAERTKAVMAFLRGQHKRISRHIPYGWDLLPDGENLIANPVEQSAIALILELRSDGLSYRQICAELEARGIRTKQGKSEWSAKAVMTIFKREMESAA